MTKCNQLMFWEYMPLIEREPSNKSNMIALSALSNVF